MAGHVRKGLVGCHLINTKCKQTIAKLSWDTPDMYRPSFVTICPEGYEKWHPHNWPVTTTNHLPPHLAN